MAKLSTSSSPPQQSGFPNRAAPNRAARRRYVKIAEAADYLQVTERTIRQMIADGRLTGYRSGGRLVRLDLNEIDAAMQPFGGAA